MTGAMYTIIMVDPLMTNFLHATPDEPFVYYLGINSLFTEPVDRITTKFAVRTSTCEL